MDEDTANEMAVLRGRIVALESLCAFLLAAVAGSREDIPDALGTMTARLGGLIEAVVKSREDTDPVVKIAATSGIARASSAAEATLRIYPELWRKPL